MTIKRLNFTQDSKTPGLEPELDISNKGHFLRGINLSIEKSIEPNFIKAGPYLGVVLRVEAIPSKDDAPFYSHWFSKMFGEGSLTDSPLFEDIQAYKIRIPELDAFIPDPSDYTDGEHILNTEVESEAQKYIELHTTYVSRESGIQSAVPGDVVLVDFGDYKKRDNPVYLGPYFTKGGTPYESNAAFTGSPSSAFANCRKVTLNGAPDGLNLRNAVDKLSQIGEGIKNFFIGDDDDVEQPQAGSPQPKNTAPPPPDCPQYDLFQTSTGLDNSPDDDQELANLRYMDEEVIPSLFPVLHEIDNRFVVTSVYRSDAVNSAVGGNPNSFHAQGLAVDYGGLAGLPKNERDAIMFAAAEHLRNNISKLPFLRTVLVETFRNHIHIDVYPKEKTQGRTAKFLKWRGADLPIESI
jgi:hypothetical protein|tara:strand:- start:34 stop:1260 length:1227 start_codon:yes stop_codon:yes gene_type:complete